MINKFKDLSNDQKNMISSELECNNKSECGARKDYYRLLDIVADEHKQTIRNIIADEINHSIILSRLTEIYSGIQPTEFQSMLEIKKEGK